MSGHCFHHYIMNVDFKAIKIDYKFFYPQRGEVVWLFFEKPLKISFFAWDLYLGKNGRFHLLGWVNECRDPFLIVIILMCTSRQWKSPFICFWMFFGKFLPVVFNRVTLCFENGVVWCSRLCHNDSGAYHCFKIIILIIFYCGLMVHVTDTRSDETTKSG